MHLDLRLIPCVRNELQYFQTIRMHPMDGRCYCKFQLLQPCIRDRYVRILLFYKVFVTFSIIPLYGRETS